MGIWEKRLKGPARELGRQPEGFSLCLHHQQEAELRSLQAFSALVTKQDTDPDTESLLEQE